MILMVYNFPRHNMRLISFAGCLLLLSLSWSIPGYGQSVDYNKIVLPAEVKTDNMEERLVQLAWQNLPQSTVLENNRDIADMRSKIAKWSWLDNISARGNLNEFAINPDANPNVANFFPRYNFGVTIPLGVFVSTPIESRIAKKQVLNTEQQINQQKLQVRKLVLTAYNNYKMYKEIFKVKNELVEDEYANLLVMEEKFQKSQISIEQYKAVTRTYNLEIEEKIKAANQMENAKLEVEALIGMKLEEVN
jgi:outer membrane protein TolC